MTITTKTTTTLIRAEEELPALVSWISSTCGSASGVSPSSSKVSFDLFDCVVESCVVEDTSVPDVAPFVDTIVASGVDNATDVANEVGDDDGGGTSMTWS